MATKAATSKTTQAKTTKPKSAPAKKNPKTQKPKKTTPSTEFVLKAPGANEVFLVGDFNGWEGGDFRMRRFKDGIYKKSVKLKPGRYEYRFVVDGEWWCDPENPHRQANSYGSENSVININE